VIVVRTGFATTGNATASLIAGSSNRSALASNTRAVMIGAAIIASKPAQAIR
jgi:hypothetical protein